MPVASKPSAAASSASSGTFANFPQFAPELIDLPGAQETNAAIQAWWNSAKYQLLQQNNIQQQTSLKIRAESSTSTGTLAAEIAEERTVRADADSALATDITTVSASLTTSIGIVTASVTALASATTTSLGHLSANYSITVTAGSVVTGMQLNSSSGGGATSSTIDFQAANFRIWDGTSTAYPIFSTSVGLVKLASTLTVNTAGKVFTGTGTYANNNTPFYVDSSSNFSLGSGLTWNGTTLTIVGSVTATTGTIGGWTINPTTISKNGAVLDSAGNLLLGTTTNDVVILSATDINYRMWVGNATAGSAAFSVTKTGVMSATGATLVGSGTTGNYVSITSSGFQVGASTATGVIYINNSGGVPYINMRYNGNVYGSWSIQSTYSAMQLSDDSGNSITIDPRPAGGIAVAGGNIVVSGAGGFYGVGTNITGISASNISSGTLATARLPSAIQIGSGSAGTPSFSFSGDTNTGIYNSAADTLDFSTGGTRRMYVDSFGFLHTLNAFMADSGIAATGDCSFSTNITVGTQVKHANGSTGAPSIAFSSETNTGLYWFGSGDMRSVIQGASVFVVQASQIVCLQRLKLGDGFQSGAPTATGYILIRDSNGNDYKMLVGT